ncbi:MAG TPA: response regulator [Kofleriaceae bacterium]|nr:response regulator [Kofleriaceae bacterium]
MERRVVIIEDERDVARLLEFNLRSAGFEVSSAGTGAEGIAAVRSKQPDVVVLDLMLPDQSGYEVCKALRADPAVGDVGVLMLTARGEPEDRILGLEVGADDYVVKPFVVREVVLRVSALANRLAERPGRLGGSDASGASAVLRVGPIELDPVTHEVKISGAPTQLRPLEYKLLQLLVSDPGRVFTREELLEQVWEVRGDINTRTVDVHVRRLRVSLGPAADVIETVHGFGYRARRDGSPPAQPPG